MSHRARIHARHLAAAQELVTVHRNDVTPSTTLYQLLFNGRRMVGWYDTKPEAEKRRAHVVRHLAYQLAKLFPGAAS